MKTMYMLTFSMILFVGQGTDLSGQIENVIVENYYISDSIDATNSTGGKMEAGTKTYRIFIDLKSGSRLRKIYGGEYHPLHFSSTDVIFNNTADGQTFGKDFSTGRLKENTVALDSWITLGQTTRSGIQTNFGIPKSMDRNGSVIGGIHNDGGSSGIINGLLTNKDPWAGIPLVDSDGMDTMTTVPGAWVSYGFKDQFSGKDTSIFGENALLSEFTSYNAYLQNSGTVGVRQDSNHVLIAQLTTKGSISFEINLEIEEFDGVQTHFVKYVARDSLLSADEFHSPYLKYPFSCGCKDPDYLEAQKKYVCEDNTQCKTKIVFGCMDTIACNFSEDANYNIQTLCCYIGFCNDLRIDVVCPKLAVHNSRRDYQFKVFPNPVNRRFKLKLGFPYTQYIQYDIYDLYARQLKTGTISNTEQEIDVSDLPSGLYNVKVTSQTITGAKHFIKE